jgi:hypothetical protein
MRKLSRLWPAYLAIPLLLVGCQDYSGSGVSTGAGARPALSKGAGAQPAHGPSKPNEAEDAEADVRRNLAKLSDDDRKLAEEQKYCAIDSENRLGEMGPPVKVMIKDQPVFLCCKGCKKQAEKDPDKTLARVKELKAKAAEEAKK